METMKTRFLDEIPDEDGNIEMSYEYDIYRFREDGKEYPVLLAKSYTDTRYEVDMGTKLLHPSGMAEDLDESDLLSPLFEQAVEYLKHDGKRRISLNLRLYWSVLDSEKPGTDVRELPYMDVWYAR